ncbi:MAG: hypothetical protein HOF38_05280 [Elusimicrobiaceae bacterium]|jgi:hypothetical protein|nr:hypothetical protein [Elusimicrobiaceae bacterium]MBT4008174.1 hypothetical protein [Elusimicrobiaceae bacterium]MBT4402526.1 hypothetical protein [Elusimicrobiaceae bacterium]MBT4439653.1 hypothetical protein [Elusimicrobiaceae bacterium]MBT5988053.1 hypothetical protein [Elusimicrobiaceae bacterium]
MKKKDATGIIKIEKIDANLIEKLTGFSREITDEYVSIYIGLESIYVAEATNKAGVLNIISLVRVPIKNVDALSLKSSEMNKNFFKDRFVWLEPIKRVFEDKKFKNKQVCITLSSDFSIYRHFVMPQIERKFWKQSIPMQAKKFIHFPFDQAMFSYNAYNFETKISKQKKLGVLFGLTDKYIVDQIKKGMKELDLDLRGIEISILSLSRLLNMKDKGSKDTGQIYGYFAKSKGSFLFVNKAKPLLQKDISFSGVYTTERRKLEISSYVDFISNQFEKDPFKETVLLGGANKETWKMILEGAVKKDIREFDINEVLGFESSEIEELSCIGGCFKYSDTFGIGFDLTGEQRSAKIDNKALMFLWKVVGLGILILIVFCVLTQMKSYMVGKELAGAKASGTLLSEFANLSSRVIKKKIEDTKIEERQLTDIFTVERVTPVMAQLVNIVPEDMWIGGFSYKYPIFSAKSKISRSKQLQINGFILSEGGRKQELEIGDKFKDDVVMDKVFRKFCTPVSTEIKYRVPNKSSAQKNEAARFTLDCSN